MKYKYVAGALITAVMLSGCGNSGAAKTAKTDACKQVNDFKLSNTSLRVTEPIALAFHKLALADNKYLYLADAAYLAYNLDNSLLYKFTDVQMLEYQKTTSQLLQFCASG